MLVTPMINAVKVFDKMTNRDFGEITSPEVCSFPRRASEERIFVDLILNSRSDYVTKRCCQGCY